MLQFLQIFFIVSAVFLVLMIVLNIISKHKG